jgi:hypothetical protein
VMRLSNIGGGRKVLFMDTPLYTARRRKYFIVLPDRDIETNFLEVKELSAILFKCGKCSTEDHLSVLEVYHNVMGQHRHRHNC